MLEDRIVFLNDNFVRWPEATVHMMSHSFGRGSAIFEVISLHETMTGPAVFRLDQHIQRFFRTAELLGMELSGSREKLQQAVLQTVERNGLKKGYIKIIGFYPQISFEVVPPQSHLDVAIFVLDPVQDVEGAVYPSDRGTSLCISKWRKLDPQTVPIEAKAAANYLNGMLARVEADKRGFKNAIMLDTHGFIAEGGTESVFLVHDGCLMTPALGTVLQSISRRSVLQLAEYLGIEAAEKRLHPDLFFIADEIFLSATPFKVLPVRKIEDRVLKDVPGPISQKLLTHFDEIISGRDKRFKDWLFPVE
jgi:branched-chain amino acid aminotransferase